MFVHGCIVAAWAASMTRALLVSGYVLPLFGGNVEVATAACWYACHRVLDTALLQLDLQCIM